MFCRVDGSGKLLERFDPGEDAWVDGLRYSQDHLGSLTGAERSAINVAEIAVQRVPGYDEDTHKATPVLAGPGDDPVDAWVIEVRPPEEMRGRARKELNELDLTSVRMIEDIFELLFADGLDENRLSREAKRKLSRRRELRTRL